MSRTVYTFDARIDTLEALVDGLTPGQRLPTQRELAKALGLTTNAVSATLRAMETDGLLERGPRRTFVRTAQPFDGESYAHRTVDVNGAAFVYKLQLFKGRVPWRVYLFTDGGRAVDMWEKTTARTNGLRVVLSRAPLAGGFEEVGSYLQSWQPKR